MSNEHEDRHTHSELFFPPQSTHRDPAVFNAATARVQRAFPGIGGAGQSPHAAQLFAGLYDGPGTSSSRGGDSPIPGYGGLGPLGTGTLRGPDATIPLDMSSVGRRPPIPPPPPPVVPVHPPHPRPRAPDMVISAEERDKWERGEPLGDKTPLH
jgi:hypothetical protein